MTREPAHYRSRDPEGLTRRQREVLGLVARGMTNGEIAQRLGLTLDGVKWHVREILSRLDVESREEAALYWREQHRPAGRLRRAIATFGPLFSLRAAIAGSAVAVGIAGAAVALGLGATRSDGEALPSHDFAETVVTATPSATPTPTVEPPAVAAVASPVPGGCIDGDLLLGSTEAVENGAAISIITITKPRGCDFSGTLEAFIVEPGASFESPAVAQDSVFVGAAAGTDRVEVRVEWRNWCAAVPPTPSAQDHRAGLVSPPGWVRISPMSGYGIGLDYPPCVDSAAGTRITITAAAFPDPPLPPAAATGAPMVTSAVDLNAFARWFSGVASARDESVLRALSDPLEVDCGLTPGNSLCAAAAPGERAHAYFMSQSGQAGSLEVFASQLMAMTARLAPGAVSAGCGPDAPSCERFVIAIDADSRQGPGGYIGFVFDVTDGVPVLCGIYPGGGDEAAVLGGGEGSTPWGTVAFAPVSP